MFSNEHRSMQYIERNFLTLRKQELMKKLLYTLFFLTVFSFPAESTDCFNGRYSSKVFGDFTVINNVVYARKQRSDGLWQKLAYDVYQPKNDTASNRPVVVLAHGGGYIDLLDQKSPDIVEMAIDLTLRGYVVISIEYREEPNPFSLLDPEKMVKAVSRALIDTRDATCSIVDTTVNFGNPYRIDIRKVIVGGVSAGAVSFLHAIFLDSISWMPQQYRQWALEVEPNSQALLDNRYCGAHVLGMIGISGALLDTSWIRPDRVYPALLLQHGTADPVVPYKYDNPFHIAALPKLMGSYLVDIRSRNLGYRCELDTWPGFGHVPFLGGFNPSALFGPNPLAIIFNPTVLDSTKQHIAHFCYSLIDCNAALPTAVKEHLINGRLDVYPNPSGGEVTLRLPNVAVNKWLLTLYDITGKAQYVKDITGAQFLTIHPELQPGLYYLKLSFERNGESYYYSGRTVIE
jgi:hypothetical protein